MRYPGSAALIWRCPSCHGRLAVGNAATRCVECAAEYEAVDGIPDLRYPQTRDAATLDDLALARRTSAEADKKSNEELIHAFFAMREGADGWTPRDTEMRTRHSLAAPLGLQGEITGWLRPVTDHSLFVDLGCGLGGFLTAAGAAGRKGIGIDNRMSVLVIAKRIMESDGTTAVLACANAEALPLADGSVGGVVMYDVVEHVDRLESALSEVSRVTWIGGAFACSTPNRFSLAPEPHVRIWGVGWLPPKFQRAYVKMRSGREYSGTRLLSSLELRRMLRRATQFEVKLSVPPIPASEIEQARGMRKVLARAYNSVAGMAVVRPVLLRIGPFFRLVGVKRASAPR